MDVGMFRRNGRRGDQGEARVPRTPSAWRSGLRPDPRVPAALGTLGREDLVVAVVAALGAVALVEGRWRWYEDWPDHHPAAEAALDAATIVRHAIERAVLGA